MSVPMAKQSELESVWAERAAQRLLEPLKARWQHTRHVVERARSFEHLLPESELDVLIAAAYLHDVGYAHELAATGFHPLHGARFVRDAGHERLAGLVAHHSASDAEAVERGFADELAEFPAEDSRVARALTYCDLTTGPNGEEVGVSARLVELGDRLGDEDPAVRAVRREAKRLAAVVDEMDALLTGRR
jgi:HD superfamily phosphodiesterase